MTDATAYRISGEPSEAGEFVVKSGSVPGIAWVVEVKPGRRVECPCTGYAVRRTCRHTAAVREALLAEPLPPLLDQLEASVRRERLRRVGLALERV